MAMRYFVGLDLGQAADFTALVVLGRRRLHHQDKPDQRRPVYDLSFIRRWHLGTPYPQIVKDVVALLRKEPLPGCLLMVDQTGVGRAVVDLFWDALYQDKSPLGRFVPITITAGRTVNPGSQSGLCVPKQDLVGVIQALLSMRRLEIGRHLPETPILVKELRSFTTKLTPAANEVFSAREGQHDDLVLAVALAAWAGEKCLPDELRPPPPAVMPRITAIGRGDRPRDLSAPVTFVI
jgi:hypothetical protein